MAPERGDSDDIYRRASGCVETFYSISELNIWRWPQWPRSLVACLYVRVTLVFVIFDVIQRSGPIFKLRHIRQMELYYLVLSPRVSWVINNRVGERYPMAKC